MSLGANGGGNLNILILEVGYVTRDPTTGIEVVTTVSIHPLVVVPTSIAYSDASRSPVAQTTGGSLVTRSGRGLQTVQLSGTFGVESRGIGPYIGSGEMRFQRFRNEVVRMSEALTREDVDAAINVLTGTPFISLFAAGFSEENSTFFVNWYDFWNDISFGCLVRNFRWTRQARNGGATGMVSYDMTIEETGPLREGGLGNTLISGLMAILGTWDDINDLVESTTLSDILGSIGAVFAIGVSELADSVAAVQAQMDSVRSLMAGNAVGGLSTSAATSGVTSFLAAAGRMETEAGDLAASTYAVLGASGQFDADSGAIDPVLVEGEGGSASLALFDQVVAFRGIADAGAFQKAAGKFFGMSREDYQAFLGAGAITGRLGPELRGSVTHRIAITDTPAYLEGLYGVNWGRILALNGLTPDEALFPGTEIQVPRLRSRGPQGVTGLPVFGSHVGRAAWGVDAAIGLRAGRSGRPLLVDGTDALEQGVDWLVAVFGGGILRSIESVPSQVQEKYLSRRLSALLLSDSRISGIDSVDVVVDPAGGFDVEVTLRAINGETVRTGGPR